MKDITATSLSIEKNTNKKWLLVIFLIWPFLGFVLSLKSFNYRLSKVLILAFFIIYGATFVINEQMDGQRYALALTTAANTSFDEFLSFLTNPYSERRSVDMLAPLLTFIASRFTYEHHLLFASFAFIFGFFYLKSISAVYQNYKITKTKNALVFMIMLPWIIPIFQINGFRMWTAAWVFFYGVYELIYNEKKKYIWLALSASFIHFSFLSANVILLLYLFIRTFIGNRITILMMMAIITFFISELPIEAIRNFITSLGGGIEVRANYLNEKHIENVVERQEQAVWFMKLADLTIFYILMMHVLVVYYYIKKHTINKRFKNFFSFSLLFLSFVNIVSLMPSGSRFRFILYVLLSVICIIFYSSIYIRPTLSKLSLLTILPFVLNAIIAIRIGSSTLNTITFFPSFVIFFFYDIKWPVIDWLF